ncbi:MAG: cysteine desulfurase NifS [Thermoplasmata archaeon]|nr:cysteine desulfurase NifS [Thermoplasmata archaeon]
MKRVYFDNSATSRTDQAVIDAMLPFMKEHYGNPSSLHGFGREAKKAMDASRASVAKLINADPMEIVFTSGGTESDNLALKGFVFANKNKGKHIIISSIEHHAVLHTCEYLQKNGFEITYLPVDSDGIVHPETLEKAIRPDTILVSIMHANNEIGTIEPIGELAKIASSRSIAFHTDAVQTVGHVSIDVKSEGVSMLSMSAHKFYGPKGVGALYVRKGIRLEPLLHGGGHERGMRSSTENVPGIVGIGKASEIAMDEMKTEAEKLTRLRNMMIDGVLKKIPRSNLNGHRTKRLPNNANFRFDFIEGEGLVLRMDMRGFALSTGSACSTKSLEPSHVLIALGLKPEQAHGSLRISMGKDNLEEEVNQFIDALPEEVAKLREMSPYNEANPMVANEPWCSSEDHDHHETEVR